MGFDFSGRRVLVTAGASGIGQGTANQFLAAGARVFVCDIDAKALEAYQAEQPSAVTRLSDVGHEAQLEKLFDGVTEKFGGLRFLVNNAVICLPTTTIHE